MKLKNLVRWADRVDPNWGFNLVLFLMALGAPLVLATCPVTTRAEAHKELQNGIEKRMDEHLALRQHEAKHLPLLNVITDTVVRLHKDGTLLDLKTPLKSPWPATDLQLVGKKWVDLFPSDVTALVMQSVKAAMESGGGQDFFFRHMLPGEFREFEARIVHSGKEEMLLILRDITERARLEYQIQEITEREQARIAQDLHDNFGQLLAGVACLAKELEKNLAEKSLPDSAHAADIYTHLVRGLTQLRNVTRGLWPVELTANDLSAALAALAADVSKIPRLNCRFNCVGPVSIPDSAVVLNLYRIAQGAIANSIKHAQAKNIEILLAAERHKITLQIMDDGVGFSPEKTAGIGLLIMGYRAKSIGATFETDRRGSGGAMVTCSLVVRPVPDSSRGES